MKVTGPIESLDFDERSGKLRLANYSRTIWVSELHKSKVKGLKVGDLVTIETEPRGFWDQLKTIQRGEAAPQPSASLVPSDATSPAMPNQPNVSPPTAPAELPPKTGDFNIPYSLGRVGELYPVLVDPEGNVVDGLHRLAVKKDWRKEVLPWVRSRKDFLVARIHANLHRRTVPKEERQRDFTELANILHNQDSIAINDLTATISELTGFSQGYVSSLLPRAYKAKGPRGPKKSTESIVSKPTQPTTLPEAKVDLEKEEARIAGTFRGAPSQDLASIYTGPCPFCNRLIRWDPEKRTFAKAA